MQAEPPKPRGLGGWLILALLSLFSYPLLLISVVIPIWIEVKRATLEQISDSGHWLLISGWNLVSTGAMTVLAVFIIPKFLGHRREVPRLMTVFFAANFTLGMANLVFNAVSTAGAPTGQSPMFPTLLRLGVAALWINYFRTSDRVRETFTRAG